MHAPPLRLERGPAGKLGGERAIIEGVQLGAIEMSFTTTGTMGAFNVFVFKVNGKLWRSLPERLRHVIETTAAEVRDYQRKLNREADGEFLRRLEAKGMEVYVPTAAEMKAWQTATAPVYEEAKRFLGGSWVAQAVQFRKGRRAPSRRGATLRRAPPAHRRPARRGDAPLRVGRTFHAR